MEQLAPVAAMVVFAYAFGGVWYQVLGRPSTQWLRMVVYPLLGIILGEGLWASYLASGPEFLGIHVVVALSATFIAVSLDILLETLGVPYPFRFIENLSSNGNKSRKEKAEAASLVEAER